MGKIAIRRPNKRRLGWKDYLRYGTVAAVRGYQAYKGYQDVKQTLFGKQVSTRPLTDQRDVVTTYRKRRMPKRKKKRYLRSLRRWRSAQMRLSPSRFFSYLDVENVSWNAGYAVYSGSFMGLLSQNANDNNLGEAWTSIHDGNSADEKAAAAKFRLDHQSLRVVIRNTTTADNENSTPTIDIDVYKVVCIKDVPNSVWPSGTEIESFMAQQKNKLRRANGMDIEVDDSGAGIPTLQQNAGTSSSNQAIGDSIWNNPMFLRYFKIIKAFKIQLGSNNQTEFSWRDSKNYTIRRDECFSSTNGLAAKKGLTKGFILNLNGRCYYDNGTPQFNSGSIVVERYVRYNVKTIPGTSPTLVYDGIA